MDVEEIGKIIIVGILLAVLIFGVIFLLKTKGGAITAEIKNFFRFGGVSA